MRLFVHLSTLWLVNICWTHRFKIKWLFGLFLRGFVPPLNFKQCVWLCLPHCSASSSANSSLLSSILTVLSLRSLQIARQMSSFTSALPSGWASTTSLSLWVLAFVSRQEGGVAVGGRHMVVRSTKHVISLNRDGPWGHSVLWCDLLVPAQPWMALCAEAGPDRETWECYKKGGCCGFRETDGAAHQMGVWGSNKVVDLEAGMGNNQHCQLRDMIDTDVTNETVRRHTCLLLYYWNNFWNYILFKKNFYKQIKSIGL